MAPSLLLSSLLAKLASNKRVPPIPEVGEYGILRGFLMNPQKPCVVLMLAVLGTQLSLLR